MARQSLRLQPYRNVGALDVIASSDLALHRFNAALAEERAAAAAEPFDDNARAQTASILMELGRYEQAGRILASPRDRDPNPTWMSIRARYDELTGNLAGARVEMAQATSLIDSSVTVPAYTRSWYHLRDAQLAFEAGDGDAAAAQFAQSLRDYPDNAMALLFQAKFYRARGDWTHALESATRSAELYPLPQALGYEADAQRALGDTKRRAQRTDELIRAEQRLFNVQGVNDRLLAMYYAEHREHLDDALRAARSDLAKRGDEIYADDTMAWVLAAMDRWPQARIYAVRATRYETQIPSSSITPPSSRAHRPPGRGALPSTRDLVERRRLSSVLCRRCAPHARGVGRLTMRARAFVLYVGFLIALNAAAWVLALGRSGHIRFCSARRCSPTRSACVTPSTPTTSARSTTSRAS